MFRLPEDLHDKYRFVALAALRAEQLQAGARPRVATLARKLTIVAQEEVALGLVVAWDPDAPPEPEPLAVVGEPEAI
jgi:DNA-directed RNA polymerase subunit K/omega